MNKQNNIFIDFHVIQRIYLSLMYGENFRSLETTQFWGATRAFVPGPIWGHAVWEELGKTYYENVSDRTKYLALFGELDADDMPLDIKDAVQFADVISTDAVLNENGYLIPIEDSSPNGKGNKMAVYRFASINVCKLAERFGSETPEIVKAFAHTFLYSMPTELWFPGSNWMCQPMSLVSVRNDQPANFVNAFEVPISANFDYHGFSKNNLAALVKYAKSFYDSAGWPVCSFGSPWGDSFAKIADLMPWYKTVEKLGEYVSEYLQYE